MADSIEAHRIYLGESSPLVADLLRDVAPTLKYLKDQSWLLDLAEFFDDQAPEIAEVVDAYVLAELAGRAAC